MFWKKWTRVYVDQSESTIGVSRVDNLNTATIIAGKVVNHDFADEVTEGADLSVGSGESIGVAFSKNVWVNGKRIC